MVCMLPASYILASQEQAIPSWIRNVALWWGEGKITDSEFLSAIKYLIDNEILMVSEYDPNGKNYLDKFSQSESEKSGTKIYEKIPERSELESMARTNPLIKGLISGQLKFYIEPTPKYAASNVDFEINRISGVSTCKNSCCGCLRPP